MRVQPPVARATRELAEKLKIAGHEVVEWDSSDHAEGYDLWLRGVLADGGSDCRALCALAGEPLVEGMLVGQPEQEMTVLQRREIDDHKTDYQRRFVKKWVESGIDAIIMPVTPWVAYRPKTWVKSHQTVAYTALWNLLNYTALAIPAGKANKEIDVVDEEWLAYQPRNEADAFNKEQCEYRSRTRDDENRVADWP